MKFFAMKRTATAVLIGLDPAEEEETLSQLAGPAASTGAREEERLPALGHAEVGNPSHARVDGRHVPERHHELRHPPVDMVRSRTAPRPETTPLGVGDAVEIEVPGDVGLAVTVDVTHRERGLRVVVEVGEAREPHVDDASDVRQHG